jgi:ABC-2 type transport system ATP-binding protein
MMRDDVAIHVEKLWRRFGTLDAVKGISFEVARGKIFSLLGPNGAGKSTTISMLSCLLAPTEGNAWVMGHSIVDGQTGVKRAIGVVPQELALYEDMSARENLTFWGRMYNLSGAELARRVEEVLALIGLEERSRERVETFSGGMKRRVNLGIALLHKPDVIIMDEPTVGIDPQSRRHILDGVKELNAEGRTVLYTTHYMEEAEELSDHIAIMDHGEIIACGTNEELVQIVGELDRVELTLNDEPGPLVETWRGLAGVSQVTPDHNPDGDSNGPDGTGPSSTIALLVDDSNRVLPALFETATAADRRITAVEIHEPNLESVFLHLTGRALRD